MNRYVLRCPSCTHRFEYNIGDNLPENIVCSCCGKVHPALDYVSLMECPHCNTYLEVPVEMLTEKELTCPQCEKVFNTANSASAEVQNAFDSTADILCRIGNAPKQLLQEKEIFDKYRIIQMLGKGGMSEVYLAEHAMLKQKCALKIMKNISAGDDPIRVKRFVRETKITHEINHPNIIRVFDIGNDAKTGYFFIAMEFINGKSLLDILQDRLFTEAELRKVAIEMAGALVELAKHNVVHRDIKPSNIMLCDDGTYKLMDLGIAKADSQDKDEITLTMDQSAIGTPSYASPEQCKSAHDVDARSDIYCLGATLYHLATGKLPFEGDTPFAILLKVVQTNPEPVEKLRPDLSSDFVEILTKMMKKDPAQRQQNAEELLKVFTNKHNYILDFLRAATLGRKKYILVSVIVLFILSIIVVIILKTNIKITKKRPKPVVAVKVEHKPESPLPKSTVSGNQAANTEKPKVAAKQITVSAAQKKVPSVILQQPLGEKPKPGNHGRNLVFRIKEGRWELESLNSKAENYPLKYEKINYLNMQLEALENLARNRRTKILTTAKVKASEKFKAQIEKIINMGPALQKKNMNTLHKMKNHLILLLGEKKLNPDTRFKYKNCEATLLDYIIKGYLPCTGSNDTLVNALLIAGANPDLPDSSNLPPLNQNLSFAKKSMLLMPLLKAGKNNIDTWQGESLIQQAFSLAGNKYVFTHKRQKTYWPLVSFLVNNRGTLSIQDPDGKNIAHYAAESDQEQLLEHLILSGFAQINAPDKNGYTPYSLAVQNNAMKAKEILERYNIASRIPQADFTQGKLLGMILSDNAKEAENALKNGAKINYIYACGLSPLQVAISANSNKTALMLYQKDPNKTEVYLKHSIYIAISSGNIEAFTQIINKNPQLDFSRLLTFNTGTKTLSMPMCIISSNKKDPEKIKKFLSVLISKHWNINSPVADDSSGTTLEIVQKDHSMNPQFKKDIEAFLIKHGAIEQ